MNIAKELDNFDHPGHPGRVIQGADMPYTAMKVMALKLSFQNREPKRVIDLGCGLGRQNEFLSKDFGFEYVGIDSSKDLITYAQQTYPDEEFRLVSSWQETGLEDQSCHATMTSHILDYLPTEDIPKICAEVFRVLMPGGLWMVVGCRPIDGLPETEGVFYQENIPCYFKESEEWRKHLTEGGFTSVVTAPDYPGGLLPRFWLLLQKK